MKTTINIILLVICSSVFSQLTFDEKNKIAQEIFDSFDEISRILYPKKRDLNFPSFEEYLASAENFRSFKSLSYNHKILKS